MSTKLTALSFDLFIQQYRNKIFPSGILVTYLNNTVANIFKPVL